MPTKRNIPNASIINLGEEDKKLFWAFNILSGFSFSLNKLVYKFCLLLNINSLMEPNPSLRILT